MHPLVYVHFCEGEFDQVMSHESDEGRYSKKRTMNLKLVSFFFFPPFLKILLDQLANEFEFQEMALLDNRDFYNQ